MNNEQDIIHTVFGDSLPLSQVFRDSLPLLQ